MHHPLFEEKNRICCFQDCAFENLKCCDYANEKKLQIFSIFLVNLLLTWIVTIAILRLNNYSQKLIIHLNRWRHFVHRDFEIDDEKFHSIWNWTSYKHINSLFRQEIDEAKFLKWDKILKKFSSKIQISKKWNKHELQSDHEIQMDLKKST